MNFFNTIKIKVVKAYKEKFWTGEEKKVENNDEINEDVNELESARPSILPLEKKLSESVNESSFNELPQNVRFVQIFMFL